MSRPARLFWIVFAVAIAIYLAMLAWTLPTLSAAAGGLAPFDMRPTGYSFEEAKALLAALGPDATSIFENVQHRLDLVYPPLLAASLFLAIGLLAPAGWGRWRWLAAAVALPGMVFDWLENAAVSHLLALGPAGITPQEVAAASRWTVLKSTLSALAMTAVLVLLAMWVWRRWRGRGLA